MGTMTRVIVLFFIFEQNCILYAYEYNKEKIGISIGYNEVVYGDLVSGYMDTKIFRIGFHYLLEK